MILATPIFYPAVEKLNFDPIWFGIVIAITVAIGVVIPPVAVCVFVVKNITKVPMGEIYKGVLPFLISLFVAFTLTPMLCSRFLSADSIIPDLGVRDRNDVIHAMVERVTALGVIIGIAAVIIMVSVGQGTRVPVARSRVAADRPVADRA